MQAKEFVDCPCFRQFFSGEGFEVTANGGDVSARERSCECLLWICRLEIVYRAFQQRHENLLRLGFTQSTVREHFHRKIDECGQMWSRHHGGGVIKCLALGLDCKTVATEAPDDRVRHTFRFRCSFDTKERA